jgi:hypothetical protein
MAMLDVAMILMSSHLTGYLRNGVHPKPHGNKHAHFSSECGKSSVPFLVLGCRWDQPNFLEHDLRRTFLKWHPRAELIMMECGHCPMQEMPVYLQTLMETFMKRHCG